MREHKYPALTKIANWMKATASTERAGEIIRHTLPHGLRIAVQFKPSGIAQSGEWLLGLWRSNAVPSPNEIAICREAFNVPPDALKSGEMQKRGKSKDEIYRGYYFSWQGAVFSGEAEVRATVRSDSNALFAGTE